MVLSSIAGKSQKKEISIQEYYPYKNEIGINFTNVLGNVLSLNPNNASSPYGLTFRRHYGVSSFRSAINVNVTNKEEDDFNNGSSLRRKITISKTDFRIGLERHIVLSQRVLFSYGFDVLGALGLENSKITDFNFGGRTFESNQKTYGFGLGPMVRLEYKISDRMYISSESSMYGFYSRTTEKLIINGSTSEEPEKKNSSLKLELPQSLFFNISF
jgi:hypothetical protein